MDAIFKASTKDFTGCTLYAMDGNEGLFYSKTHVLAETPLVGETPTKWEKSSDRCWLVYHMPYREAIKSGKAAELHRFDCYLLLSHAWCCKLTSSQHLQTTV